MKKNDVNIGIIGFGTVGTGTVKILMGNQDIIRKRAGFNITIKRISDLDIASDRGIELPGGILTNNAEDLVNDPDIDIVVELIGGIHPAKEYILKAIQNKKHIVTANKALIATEGNEIFSEASRCGVEVGFEASVAGGIPIIKILREGLAANRILNVYGIINGTSNYILTRMTEEGIEFSHALKEAQRLGYAEADPTLDIEGMDSAHKLAILSSLAYDIPLSYNDIYTEGITRVTPQDIEFASELGYKIKLLAIAKAVDGTVELRVHPTMVPKDYLISGVDGIFNAIYIEGDAVGSTLYYGKGAGDMPTGSAIASDIIDIARRIRISIAGLAAAAGGEQPKGPSVKIRKMDDVESMYYFRFSALDRPGVLSKIAGVLGDNNISIVSVIQKGRHIVGAVPLVVLTHTAKEKDVLQAIKTIDKLPIVTDNTYFIRVEGKED